MDIEMGKHDDNYHKKLDHCLASIKRGQQLMIDEIRGLPCRKVDREDRKHPVKRIEALEMNQTWIKGIGAGMLVLISKLVFWK